ncbi:MAG: DUF2809 domain-containing protein [Chitinophagaceae bacterium]|nr:MAG: DUF2809 domain-containing protein [Chitinophagaceae bacterium]
MKFRFSTRYFLIALLLFLVEVLIALHVDDAIIRPYVGDVLVVILVYTAVRAFLYSPVQPMAVAVLLFAFAIETAQYFRLVYRLGLGHSRLARTVIGIGFDWKDLLAYTIGFFIILLAEHYRRPAATRTGG